MDSLVVTMMHVVRGFFRFANIDALVASGPASMPLTVPTNTYVTPARLGAWHRTMGANLPTQCASSPRMTNSWAGAHERTGPVAGANS